ncbi:hypothetical protein IAQ61_007530 [Plenodomus lingam]|uniref:uncharacterized protein n=1 Tax=Leptosphaeria maculans TaxID=5022 RepID=UPI00332DB2C9|nr:hypothetical protein IAQ61_007530 [Plenodomus lingam]
MAGFNLHNGNAYAPGNGMANGNLQGFYAYPPGGSTQCGNAPGQMSMSWEARAAVHQFPAQNLPQQQWGQGFVGAAPSQQQPQQCNQAYNLASSGQFAQQYNAPWGLPAAGPSHQPLQQHSLEQHHGHSGHRAQVYNQPWDSTVAGPSYQPLEQGDQFFPEFLPVALSQQQYAQAQFRDEVTEAPVAPPVIDLTGCPSSPFSPPSSPAPTTPPTPLPAPAPLPPPAAGAESPVPKQPTRERITYLRKNIIQHRNDYPVACTLFESWDKLTKQQKQRYCSDYWPSNEAALANLHEMAKLSPQFPVIYTHMIQHAAAVQAALALTNEEDRNTALADAETAHAARTAELQASCNIAMKLRSLEEERGQYRALRTTIRGKKQGKRKIAHRQEIAATVAVLDEDIAAMRTDLAMTVAQREQAMHRRREIRKANLARRKAEGQQARLEKQECQKMEKAEKAAGKKGGRGAGGKRKNRDEGVVDAPSSKRVRAEEPEQEIRSEEADEEGSFHDADDLFTRFFEDEDEEDEDEMASGQEVSSPNVHDAIVQSIEDDSDDSDHSDDSIQPEHVSSPKPSALTALFATDSDADSDEDENTPPPLSALQSPVALSFSATVQQSIEVLDWDSDWDADADADTNANADATATATPYPTKPPTRAPSRCDSLFGDLELELDLYQDQGHGQDQGQDKESVIDEDDFFGGEFANV